MYGDAEHVVNNRMFGFFPNGVNMLPQKKYGAKFLVAIVNEGSEVMNWIELLMQACL